MVAQYLTSRGANIEESRMAAIGGLFTMTVMFSHDDESIVDVTEDIDDLQSIGLECSFYQPTDFPCITKQGLRPFELEVRCMDHPGVVKEVVQVMHDHGATVDSLKTERECAPFCGTPVFRLSAAASLPRTVRFDSLHRGLRSLAITEGLDMKVVQLEEPDSDDVVECWTC